MKAVICREISDSPRVGIDDIEPPTPKAGEALVSVKAAALNFADLLMLQGKYQEKPELPFVPGMELAGEVTEINGESNGLTIGDPVVGVIGYGALAETVAAPTNMLLRKPHILDWPDAASFGLVYGTAHLGLTRRARLTPEDTLIVTGAGGGAGMAAVETGKAIGATVIAISSGKEKTEAILGRGADHVIDRKAEDVRDRIRELANGNRKIFFDTVGGQAFETCLRAASFEDEIMVIGFAGGEIQKIPANILLVKNVTIHGYYWGQYGQKAPQLMRDSFEELSQWIDAGRLSPAAGTVFGVKKIDQALELLASGKAVGKIAVELDF